MPHLPIGEKVFVRTEVDDGAFPGEQLVTVETTTGPVSGFVRSDKIVHRHGNTYLLAEVEGYTDRVVTVRLSGSFFTTTGIAYIPDDGKLLRAG
jgi:hypothetical protein